MAPSSARGRGVRHPSPVLAVEKLEDRVVPSWSGTPPSLVPVPINATVLPLNAAGDAAGAAAITANEVDWYRVTVPAGRSVFTATTPASSMDTVLGVFSSTGRRIASNDDIAYPSNTDSRVTVTLAAGTYFVGITNYTGTPGGSYSYAVDAPVVPVAPPPPPPVPPVPPPPPPASAFDITLNLTGMTSSQRQVFQQAADVWERVIVGDLPAATYRGTPVDDILIDGSAVFIDGPNGILGQAGPTQLRATGSRLPVHGIMQFDSADLSALERSGGLLPVILHEMGHVLGIGTLWGNLLVGNGTRNPRFVGPQATAAYNAIFNTNAAGVPVEADGGPGTAYGHWSDSILGNELMTGYLSGGANPLSRITAGSLADMGYQVNLAAADQYGPPALTAGGPGGTGGGPGGAIRAGTGTDGGCGCEICAGMTRPPVQVGDTVPGTGVGADTFPAAPARPTVGQAAPSPTVYPAPRPVGRTPTDARMSPGAWPTVAVAAPAAGYPAGRPTADLFTRGAFLLDLV